MGTETTSRDSHPHKPNNETISPLPIPHRNTNPMLPLLGLPSDPLSLSGNASPSMVGFSIPQKGIEIRASRYLVEVELPVLPAVAGGYGGRSGGREMGKRGEESVCEEEAEEEEAGERSESFHSSFGSEHASVYSLVVGSYP